MSVYLPRLQCVPVRPAWRSSNCVRSSERLVPWSLNQNWLGNWLTNSMEQRRPQKACSCWVKFLHFVEPQKSLPPSQEVLPIMNHLNPTHTHIVWLRSILISEHLVPCLLGCLFPSRILDITTLAETGDSLSRLFLLMWFQVIKKTSVTEPEDSPSFPRSLPMYSILSQFIPIQILRMPLFRSPLPTSFHRNVLFIFICLPFASLWLFSWLTITPWWWTRYVPPKRRRSLPGSKNLVNIS